MKNQRTRENQILKQTHIGPFTLADSLLCSPMGPLSSLGKSVSTLIENKDIRIDDAAIADCFWLSETSYDYHFQRLKTTS